MDLQGLEGPPQYVRIPITDYYCAALATQGILAALFVRERTGRGQRVETSLLQAIFALQSGTVVRYAGRPNLLRDNPVYRLYRAGDGQWFFLACGNQAFWGKLCTALGLERLADDPRFASWLRRIENREALLPLMEEAFASRPRAHWLGVLAAHDIPAAPVQKLDEFLDDPAVRHHQMVREYDHPEVGRLRLMGLPLRFSSTPTRDPGPPPTLGQHTREVLAELGYDTDTIETLRRRGVLAGWE
jgi:crotonobetainyl-CoA:carnitine CoA-transferase CaiB-like acyl-CoA transferase